MTAKTIDYALDDKHDERSAFSAAVLWYRLAAAESAVQSAVGTLDHPLVEQIDALQDKAWDLLWHKTCSDRGGNAERERTLDHARDWVKEHG